MQRKKIFVNRKPIKVKSGYPVGCAIPRVEATAASSPESIWTTPGASVKK